MPTCCSIGYNDPVCLLFGRDKRKVRQYPQKGKKRVRNMSRFTLAITLLATAMEVQDAVPHCASVNKHRWGQQVSCTCQWEIN